MDDHKILGQHHFQHIHRQIKKPALTHDNTLHIVVVVSNPVRFHSRYRLARECIRKLHATENCQVHVVEAAFGDRQHELKDLCDELKLSFLPLRTKHELWHKENMINLGVRYLLPRDWKYLAWVDADVFWPEGYNWPLETIHQLQHYHVVQPWKDCVDLGFSGDIMLDAKLKPIVHTSFCYVHRMRVPKQTHPEQLYKYAHSGFAWSCTRLFWENVSDGGGAGLLDKCIVGSADHHQAFAMINQASSSVHGKMPEEYKRYVKEWQDRAFKITQGSLGFVKTRIEHKFHGSKKSRYYRERWQIFIDHAFNPHKDLQYDESGMLHILGKPALKEEIRDYFRSRNEDSIDE